MRALVIGALGVMSASVMAQSPPTAGAAQVVPPHSALLTALEASLDPKQLRQYHDLLGSEPHVAGTDGDARQIKRLELAFRHLGLEVETHEFWALLSRPISARVEIVAPASERVGGLKGSVGDGATPPRRGVLSVIEKNLAEDPAAAHPDLTWGWNAYSASGDVTAEVVYANYGTRDDFARLKALGINLTGKIVIARYGGNFRGYKAKFAQEAGAIGLLMYIDPADSGFTKGDVYPSGTWANDTCIQRGSILSLPYWGDPLTPGTPATKDAARLEESTVELPKIIVQPIGYGAAGQILSQMTGAEVPDASWRGGLQMPYRIEGGAALHVRIKVEQKREVRRTANVLARLRGTANDGSFAVVGCHHDAWGFGAADPLAGTIVLMETARAFAKCAAEGMRPKSDLLFCAWGAEEFGIIGSTEWVEGHEAELKNATVYVNLDMASMGPNLGITASPSIQAAVARTCGVESAKVAAVGGGSDHVGFIFWAGVPCVTIGAGGAPGTSYHSNYDTTAWYRKTVGEDYGSAMTVARATLATLAEFADVSVAQVSALALVASIRSECAKLAERSVKAPSPLHESIATAAREVDACFAALEDSAREFDRQVAAAGAVGAAPDDAGKELASRARLLDRAMIDPAGVLGRPWFRNLAIASDRDSGYASTQLPGLADAEDVPGLLQGRDALCACATRLGLVLRQ